MFEKVNPSHPDKIADRIAGAIVDLAYSMEEAPKVAVEVLLGHDSCFVVGESSVEFSENDLNDIVDRITNDHLDVIQYNITKQDSHLAENESYESFRCGDNGIFKGCIITHEQACLTEFANAMYDSYPYDGKYILDFKKKELIVCQSNISDDDNQNILDIANLTITGQSIDKIIINPLGPWTGGLNVDTGCTNRKLGSDLGYAVTGGGIHGKDLTKSDVAITIYLSRLAAIWMDSVECNCAIGDETVDIGGAILSFNDIIQVANQYIQSIGGFEKFAEWGIIRP